MPKTSQQEFLQPDGANPALGAALVTPNDGAALPNLGARALYIGTTGNVRVTTAQGDDVLFTAVPVGILPISVSQVWATNTTASNIIALY